MFITTINSRESGDEATIYLARTVDDARTETIKAMGTLYDVDTLSLIYVDDETLRQTTFFNAYEEDLDTSGDEAEDGGWPVTGTALNRLDAALARYK